MPKGTYPETVCYIHHEAGAAFSSLDPLIEAGRMRSVQAYDMDRRGYADIPYSFGMFPSGRAYEGRDYTWDDSATGGQNGTSISIFFPGNYQFQYPTNASLAGCAELIVFGINMGQLTRDCRILGHNQSPDANTACPGRNLISCLPGIRDRVLKLLTPNPVPVPSGGLMSVLSVVAPVQKAGAHKDGRFSYFSHSDKVINGWNGASLYGDSVVAPWTNQDSADFKGCRQIPVPVTEGHRIIGLMYGTLANGSIDYGLIVACTSDGGTYAYKST